MTLWITCRVRDVLPSGHVAWELLGVFETEGRARAACVGPDDDVQPIALNMNYVPGLLPPGHP